MQIIRGVRLAVSFICCLTGFVGGIFHFGFMIFDMPASWASALFTIPVVWALYMLGFGLGAQLPMAAITCGMIGYSIMPKRAEVS